MENQANGSNSSSYDSYGQARQKTGEVIDEVQNKAGEVVDQIKEQATTQVSTQKERLADGIQNAAAMVLMGSDQLRQNNQEGIAQYTDQIANKMDEAAIFLRERGIGDIASELENFARREPVLFLGGAFTVGLLAARFLKSSRPSQPFNPNTTTLARRQGDATRATTQAPLTPKPVTKQEAQDFATAALEPEGSSVGRHFGEDIAAGAKKQTGKSQPKSQNQDNELVVTDAL